MTRAERLNGARSYSVVARHKRACYFRVRFGLHAHRTRGGCKSHKSGPPPGGREDRFVRLRVFDVRPTVFIVETWSHVDEQNAKKNYNKDQRKLVKRPNENLRHVSFGRRPTDRSGFRWHFVNTEPIDCPATAGVTRRGRIGRTVAKKNTKQ